VSLSVVEVLEVRDETSGCMVKRDESARGREDTKGDDGKLAHENICACEVRRRKQHVQ